MNPTEATEVIQRLGGTTKTAALCEVSPQAVSQWRENGIPKAQRKFLLAIRPDAFASPDSPKKPFRRKSDLQPQ